VTNVVLDSSAILAMFLNEPGGKRVEGLFDAIESGGNVKVAVSTVNVCEVLTRMQRDNKAITARELYAALSGADIVDFQKRSVELAAGYARVNQALSLGDRACLALARTQKATAWTADRFWGTLSLDVPIKLIRP
jgi:ribonuclease VapC